jgi:hypothetical protein
MIPNELFQLVGVVAVVSNTVTALLALALWIGAYAYDLAERRML